MISSKTIFDYDGKAILIKNFIDKDLINQLLEEIDFKSESIKMYGKLVVVPRLVAYQGDTDYSYSNLLHLAAPFSPIVSTIKKAIEQSTNTTFNSVLINLYRNGKDYMGYHQDNEPELNTSLIASLSFGASRKFKFKHQLTKQVYDVILQNGDLLLMHHCQSKWKHALPKSLKVGDPRINLTFRIHK